MYSVEQTAQHGNQRRYEVFIHIPHLTLMTCVQVPLNVVLHHWPPELVGDPSFDHKEVLVSQAVMRLSQDGHASLGHVNDFVLEGHITAPELAAFIEELGSFV